MGRLRWFFRAGKKWRTGTFANNEINSLVSAALPCGRSGQALALGLLKRFGLDQQSLPFIPFSSAAPFQDNGAQRGVFSRPTCQRRIPGWEKHKMIQSATFQAKRAALSFQSYPCVTPKFRAAFAAFRFSAGNKHLEFFSLFHVCTCKIMESNSGKNRTIINLACQGFQRLCETGLRQCVVLLIFFFDSLLLCLVECPCPRFRGSGLDVPWLPCYNIILKVDTRAAGPEAESRLRAELQTLTHTDKGGYNERS